MSNSAVAAITAAASVALAGCGAAEQPTAAKEPTVAATKPSVPPSPTSTPSSANHRQSGPASGSKPGITVAQLRHYGILVKAPNRTPMIGEKQAIRIGIAKTGEEKSPSARLFRVTTPEYGPVGEDGEVKPRYRDHLTWVVTLYGRWVPYISGPWRPASPSKPPKPRGFRTIALIDADTGKLLLSFA
jgi:hypothetical protein